MKQLKILSLILVYYFALAVQSFASEPKACFSWSPNSETNLKGYNIHYGTTSRAYTEVSPQGLPTIIDGRVHGCVTGFKVGVAYYFAATAYDEDNFESDYSNEIVWTAHELLDPVNEFALVPEKKLTITVE